MHHNRNEVIERTIREYQLLDQLITNLSAEEWAQQLDRSATKDPWTVKDAVAHITHWKADVARSARGQRRPPEQRGLLEIDANHLIFLHWHARSPQDVLTWHRQVQDDLLSALRAAPEQWFDGRKTRPEWPYDLDGHSAFHRVKDIERALKEAGRR
jgi:hypothetical protein